MALVILPKKKKKPKYSEVLRPKGQETGYQEVPMDIDKINALFDLTTKKEK